MKPLVFTVTTIDRGLLSVMARPRTGDWIKEEFQALGQLGIHKLVSLLEPAEALEVGLQEEAKLCLTNGIAFQHFPIPDRGLPNTVQARALVEQLKAEIHLGKQVVIHCRAGIGRTGIIAGAILKAVGYDTQSAIQLISEARGIQIPDTIEQKQWLIDY